MSVRSDWRVRSVSDTEEEEVEEFPEDEDDLEEPLEEEEWKHLSRCMQALREETRNSKTDAV